jgi:tRNA uridine 5-carboxymethylaminomethyl modification enzyme
VKEIDRLCRTREGSCSLAQILRRPGTRYADLSRHDPTLSAEVVGQVEIGIKYEGYIERQIAEVERFEALESKQIPSWLSYDRVPGLRLEARQKLAQIRPGTVGQASRISGVSPADLSLILVAMKRAAKLAEGGPAAEEWHGRSGA